MKFTQKMHQSVTFQATSSTCSCLYSFPPNKIENLSSWTSEVVSRVLRHKGVEAEGGGWGWRLGVEAGGGGWGWRGGQKIGLKMEADHDWSPDTRLQGCAGSLVADT